MKKNILIACAVLLCAGLIILVTSPKSPTSRAVIKAAIEDESITLIKHPKSAADKIVNGAKTEVLRGVCYDASYMQIPYPNGDVPKEQGACTDVVIRALRNAGYDLQKLIHEDMTHNFRLYPKKWGLSRPDSNIDHRRVPNHIAFMRRFGKELPTSTTGAAADTWKPGDIIYWDLGSGLTHCGIISNDQNADGTPLVIHNIGPAASQQDCLNNWQIIGHFRYPAK